MKLISLKLTSEQAILLSESIDHAKQDFEIIKEEMLTSIENQLNNLIAKNI